MCNVLAQDVKRQIKPYSILCLSLAQISDETSFLADIT